MITAFLLAYTEKLEDWENLSSLTLFAFELIVEVAIAVTTIGYFAQQGM